MHHQPRTLGGTCQLASANFVGSDFCLKQAKTPCAATHPLYCATGHQQQTMLPPVPLPQRSPALAAVQALKCYINEKPTDDKCGMCFHQRYWFEKVRAVWMYSGRCALRCLQVPAPASEYFHDFLGDAAPPRAMLLGTAQGLRMSLGILEASKNVHIAIGARALAVQDLRLAYRCTSVPAPAFVPRHVDWLPRPPCRLSSAYLRTSLGGG